jgi:preprotein translocase subunit SecF
VSSVGSFFSYVNDARSHEPKERNVSCTAVAGTAITTVMTTTITTTTTTTLTTKQQQHKLLLILLMVSYKNEHNLCNQQE